uniref:Rhodanese domain-containing protein n=1 Tax=Heligmosomoides polygyrus TaxID=6339 RepID=A0A183FRF7_HELPZ
LDRTQLAFHRQWRVSRYIRFDLYPPKEFEKYIRLLGVDAGDHVVLYGRESMAGMLWPARAWWTFKVKRSIRSPPTQPPSL